MTTPAIKNLIHLVEWGKIIVLHVQYALVNKSVPSSARQQGPSDPTKTTSTSTTFERERPGS